jgi:hypothetical protein
MQYIKFIFLINIHYINLVFSTESTIHENLLRKKSDLINSIKNDSINKEENYIFSFFKKVKIISIAIIISIVVATIWDLLNNIFIYELIDNIAYGFFSFILALLLILLNFYKSFFLKFSDLIFHIISHFIFNMIFFITNVVRLVFIMENQSINFVKYIITIYIISIVCIEIFSFLSVIFIYLTLKSIKDKYGPEIKYGPKIFIQNKNRTQKNNNNFAEVVVKEVNNKFSQFYKDEDSE